MTFTNVLTSAHAGQPPITIKTPFQMLRVVGEWAEGKFTPAIPFRVIDAEGRERIIGPDGRPL